MSKEAITKITKLEDRLLQFMPGVRERTDVETNSDSGVVVVRVSAITTVEVHHLNSWMDHDLIRDFCFSVENDKVRVTMWV